MTESGIPVEVFLSHGSYSDVNALYGFSSPVPTGSVILEDRAYNACAVEDELAQDAISINPIRKRNSKRRYESFLEYVIKFIRKSIEFAFSVITKKFPDHIHAVTSRGFELKVFLLILAYGIEKCNDIGHNLGLHCKFCMDVPADRNREDVSNINFQ